jgi:hypothetical protein
MSYGRHTDGPESTAGRHLPAARPRDDVGRIAVARAMIVALWLGGVGCGTVDVGPPLADVNACRPSQTFFATEIWPNFLGRDYNGQRCSDGGCHDTASGRELVLTPPSTPLGTPLSPEWIAVYRSATRQLLCTNVSSSALLARPDGRQTHKVKLIDPDGPEATLVKMWVTAP